LGTNTSTCKLRRSAGYFLINAVSSGDWDLEIVTTLALRVVSNAAVTARPMPLVVKHNVSHLNAYSETSIYFEAPVTIITGFCIVVAML